MENRVTKLESAKITTLAQKLRRELVRLDAKYFDPEDGDTPNLYAKDHDQLYRLGEEVDRWLL